MSKIQKEYLVNLRMKVNNDLVLLERLTKLCDDISVELVQVFLREEID